MKNIFSSRSNGQSPNRNLHVECLERRQLLSASVSSADQQWMEETNSGDIMEITLGNLAQTHAVSQKVQNFGARMASDHTKDLHQLEQLAISLGVTLPEGLTSQQKSDVNRLSQLQGTDFDQAYSTFMVGDHHEDIASHTSELNSTSNPALKSFATTGLVMLKKHLSLAHRAANFAAQETTLSKTDTAWLQTTDASDIMEITLGQLAQTHASSPTVKALGARLVSDHTQSDMSVDAVAIALGITLPKALTQEYKDDIDRLSKLSGSDFDQAYSTFMVSDHHDDISSFSDEQKSTKNSLLKELTAATLPMLQKHLSLAHAAVDSLTGT